MDNLTIGQMAVMNNVSEQTLRLYEREGLLEPYNRGTDNGYRYYNIKQCAVLDMITHMKALGMSLKEIKSQLDTKSLQSLENILLQRRKSIDEEISALKVQRRAIERMMESYERYRSAPPDGTIVLEYISARQIYCIDTQKNFYGEGMDTYESILRQLRDRIAKDSLPKMYFCNVGSILRQENLIAEKFYSTEIFVFVDREFVDQSLIQLVPAGSYVCIYCDNFHKEKEYAQKLLNHVEKMGYRICGDYLCETIVDVPVVGNGERGMFLRLQVPVEFAKQ